jgi:MFS family permease
VNLVQELSRELAGVGVRGRLRRRILAEVGDHLACDPDADLGEPSELARQFADELGTRRARSAGFQAFAALAIAGPLFAVSFVSSGWAGPNATRVYASSALLGYLGVVLVLLAPQLSLVAGSMAALRSFRRRGERVITRSEATVIGRRAGVALASGLASMAGLVLVALEFQGRLAGWWTGLTLGVAAFGACAIAIAAPAVLSSLRLLPAASGPAGDVFDDLGGVAPARLRGQPWAFAVFVAAAVALVITLAGAAQADTIDGALRGLADGVACLIGFAVLGPYLGLRARVRSPCAD